MCVIRFGGEDKEFLAIALQGRSHPGCTDYWDGNWLSAQVEIVVGGFRGSVAGDLRSEELADFHTQLSRLQRRLHGKAEFTTMEGWLSIRIEGDGKGHMLFDCTVRDEPGIGNTLECSLALDQTYLTKPVLHLGEALRHYPVVGGVGRLTSLFKQLIKKWA